MLANMYNIFISQKRLPCPPHLGHNVSRTDIQANVQKMIRSAGPLALMLQHPKYFQMQSSFLMRSEMKLIFKMILTFAHQQQTPGNQGIIQGMGISFRASTLEKIIENNDRM